MCVTARRVSLRKASVSTVSSDSYKQATLCISEFNKDHTAANILSKPKDQINVWLPSSRPCCGIITDNRARAAKAMRWQIYTCAMFLYFVYICCYKTVSRTLVSVFWLQNPTYFRALWKLYNVISVQKTADEQNHLRKTIQRCFAYFPMWAVEIDQTSIFSGLQFALFEERVQYPKNWRPNSWHFPWYLPVSLQYTHSLVLAVGPNIQG